MNIRRSAAIFLRRFIEARYAHDPVMRAAWLDWIDAVEKGGIHRPYPGKIREDVRNLRLLKAHLARYGKRGLQLGRNWSLESREPPEWYTHAFGPDDGSHGMPPQPRRLRPERAIPRKGARATSASRGTRSKAPRQRRARSRS